VAFEGKTIRIVGDFVADKTVQTRQKSYMKFGTFFDEEGTFFDTVHFPQTLGQYPLRGAGLYLLEGKVVLDFGYPALEIFRCAKMPLKADPRSE
jgi:DNA polymerase-3 subunit alpha